MVGFVSNFGNKLNFEVCLGMCEVEYNDAFL